MNFDQRRNGLGPTSRRPHGRRRLGAVLAGAVSLALVAGACGSDDKPSTTAAPAESTTTAASESSAPQSTESDTSTPDSVDDSGVTLTIYTNQHADLVDALTKAYTDVSGVKFNIQNDATVGQIQAEGAATPADVFLSEDPTQVAQLGAEGLLTPIDAATLAQVRPGLSSGAGNWVAYAARARVLYYNPNEIDEADLPRTLADLTEPQYKGMFAWAPSGAFVATAQYLISTNGADATRAFLTKIRDNGVNEQKNGNVRDTVEAGKHAMGLSNHYYWWILANQNGGPDKLASKIYHFPEVDAGNLVLSSGAGILASSKNVDAAQRFVAWLTAADGGQQIFASDSLGVSGAQYPVAIGVASPVVGDLDEIQSPSFDMDVLANADEAQEMLKELGMSKG